MIVSERAVNEYIDDLICELYVNGDINLSMKQKNDLCRVAYAFYDGSYCIINKFGIDRVDWLTQPMD